jgi:predicted HTH transcriptional regulator
MPFADKPPTQLTESDLAGLIGIEPEGKSVDYKRDSVGSTDADKKEFLYDASSFANSQGGYLVFGMDEAQGLPSQIVGISNPDPDKEILRLEQLLRAGVRPAISGVSTAAVRLASGGSAIVMRIPKSWNPPHQVTYQNVFRFYARDSNGNI